MASRPLPPLAQIVRVVTLDRLGFIDTQRVAESYSSSKPAYIAKSNFDVVVDEEVIVNLPADEIELVQPINYKVGDKFVIRDKSLLCGTDYPLEGTIMERNMSRYGSLTYITDQIQLSSGNLFSFSHSSVYHLSTELLNDDKLTLTPQDSTWDLL